MSGERGVPGWVTAMLRLHPRAYRERYGDGLREMMAARAAEPAGGAARLRFVVREGAGLLSSAVRAWLREFGSLRGGPGPGRELRDAVRRLMRTPAFTLAAVGMLAVGVGSTMAVYTLLHRVVLRPLPYADADRLVWLDHRAPGFGMDAPVGTTTWLVAHYASSSRLLESVAVGATYAETLVEPGAPAERLSAAVVSPSTAPLLGVAPLLGRWFDAQPEPAGVVLSERLWRTRFGADPGILGRSIRLGAVTREVIGVMPARFAFPDARVSLWTGREFPISYGDRGFNYVAIGRMAPHATVGSLRTELQSLVATAAEAPGAPSDVAGRVENGQVRADPVSLKEHVVGSLRLTLWLLLGAVLLLLATAWANVANLFLVRAESRRREVAVRRALGAGHSSIARFFVAEGLVIGVAAAAASLALAWGAVRLVVAFAPTDLPRATEVAIDAHVVVVTVALALVAGLVLTLIPLTRATPDAAGTLREGGRGATAGRASLRTRAVLMTAQVAFAMLLLAGAGLLLRSWQNARAMDPGFHAPDLLFVEVGLPRAGYATREAQSRFFEGVAGRIAALPRVEAVGVATCPPLDGYCWGEAAVREDPAPSGTGSTQVVSMRRVTPGYFDALELPILEGRAFEARDLSARSDVVVLSRETAARLFPDVDPVGRRVAPGGAGEDAQWFTIVGVAEDAATRSVLETAPEAVFYLPLRDSRDDERTVAIDRATLLIRSDADPAALVPAVRAIIQDEDATVAAARIRTLHEVLAADRAAISFTTVLLLLAGTAGLVLSALGVYAVFAYAIGRRTAEFGLRLALGADAGDLYRIVFGQAGAVVGIGILLGIAGAIGAGRLLAHLLFGVAPWDPLALLFAALLLAAMAGIAVALPTRRATRLRPVEALRGG